MYKRQPANRPGSFTKELWVYSSEKRKIATLTVQGSVIPRQKTVEELYPVDAGGGLRLASTLNAFSYIYPGRQVQAAIGYANTSKRPVRLELRPETTSGALRTDYPKQIAPGERGEINFAYPVSYTHLDVYKRQLFPITCKKITPFITN